MKGVLKGWDRGCERVCDKKVYERNCVLITSCSSDLMHLSTVPSHPITYRIT